MVAAEAMGGLRRQAAQVMRRGEVLGRKQVLGAISPKEPGEPCTDCGPEHNQSVLHWGTDLGSWVVGQSLKHVALW